MSENPAQQEKPQRDAKGRFPPGVSGNPRGRPAAGASYIEWLNTLAGYTRGELEEVRDDEESPELRRRAARDMLSESDNSIDRICDRTVGRPKQVVAAQVAVSSDPADALRRAQEAAGIATPIIGDES